MFRCIAAMGLSWTSIDEKIGCMHGFASKI